MPGSRTPCETPIGSARSPNHHHHTAAVEPTEPQASIPAFCGVRAGAGTAQPRQARQHRAVYATSSTYKSPLFQ
ncbi:hypothetical protein BV20DRAFT_776137 [Pilatotrama ljubarskyi]|nr:hypothetical protein BV20DRAFT_776137 [Pilatotrama ljubarskyi]